MNWIIDYNRLIELLDVMLTSFDDLISNDYLLEADVMLYSIDLIFKIFVYEPNQSQLSFELKLITMALIDRFILLMDKLAKKYENKNKIENHVYKYANPFSLN